MLVQDILQYSTWIVVLLQNILQYSTWIIVLLQNILEYSPWIVVLVQNILEYSTWIIVLVQVQGSSPFKLMRVLCSKFGWTTDGEVLTTQIYHRTLVATC